MRGGRSRAGALVTVAALSVALAACTASEPRVQTSPGLSSASVTSSAPVPTGSSSGGLTDSASPSGTPTALTTRPPTVVSSAVAGDSCRIAQLAVRVLRGGADTGRQIALITFTNTSVAACSMFGFPGVSLRLGVALLGQPAQRSAEHPGVVKLAPGEQGQAQITDFSRCQSSLSDTVRVYPPNLREFVDRPLQLRGCRIEVSPVTHS